MRLLQNIPAWGNARQKLVDLGIHFDRVLTTPIRRMDWFSGRMVEHSGIHYYFMRGDSDVAYWTQFMDTLMIHDQPRRWGQEIIRASSIVPCVPFPQN